MALNFPFEMAIQIQVLILLLFCPMFHSTSEDIEPHCSTGIYLHTTTAKINVNREPKLCIFCYPGQERTWLRLWTNPRITMEAVEKGKKHALDDLAVFYGTNVSDVRQQSASVLSSLLLLKEEHSFAPFNASCIGVASTKAYRVHFKVKNPELWYLAYIAIGTTIFFFAPSWSRNLALHYTTGMTIGVLASVLILMFILTRLMPQRLKMVSYVVMGVSSSACLFMWQVAKTYLQDILQDHWQLALGYVVASALLSFGLIYRFGPVTDGRTLNLVCWVMQAGGLLLVYQGTQIPEASAAIILLVLALYLSPKAEPQFLKRLRRRLFRRPRRLLTEAEFDAEGEEETRRALEDLRQFCHSPDCNAWRVVNRLKSPQQFARFVDGGTDVSDGETDKHQMFVHNNPYLQRQYDNGDGDSDSEGELRPRPHPSNNHQEDSESEIEDTVNGFNGYGNHVRRR